MRFVLQGSVPPPSGAAALPPSPAKAFTGPTAAARAPELVYPNDGVLLPPNLFEIEVHFRPGPIENTLFEIAFANALTDVRAYARCAPVGDPVGLTTAVVPPPPDMTKSTRQRFAAHAVDSCAVCHDRIDNFGFAFEGFDGMGRVRDKDNNQLVDASVNVVGTDFDGSYANSNALVKAMSTSHQVRECFARHMFRALATTSDPAVKASEDDFVKYWEANLPQNGGR